MKVNYKLIGIAGILSICLIIFFGGCNVVGSKNAATSKPILWINGTYAVLTKINNQDVNIFGGVKPNIFNKQVALNLLKESWEVTTKDELDDQIYFLTKGEMNKSFLEEVDYYEISSYGESEFDEAIKEVQDSNDVSYFQNMFDAYNKFGDKAILGWDLSRATQLCASGYIADFYTYEEATDKALVIGKQIQNTFNSWDDFFDSYLYGYVFWSEDDINDPNSKYAERVKILDELRKDPNSPLKLDWNLDLDTK